MPFMWNRYGGYECTTQGDPRFSAFNARMPDGRTIKHHYQCDVKGYQPSGTNWRLGKGKPPLNPTTNLWEEYLALWRTWAQANPTLMQELRARVRTPVGNGILSDRFATTPINQAHALATLLNEGL